MHFDFHFIDFISTFHAADIGDFFSSALSSDWISDTKYTVKRFTRSTPPAWFLWALFALIFVIGEFIISTFFMFCFALGAICAAVAAYFNLALGAQVGFFLTVGALATTIWGDFVEYQWEWTFIVFGICIAGWLIYLTYT